MAAAPPTEVNGGPQGTGSQAEASTSGSADSHPQLTAEVPGGAKAAKRRAGTRGGRRKPLDFDVGPLGAQEELHPDIMQRRCPPLMRFGHGSGRSVLLTDREKKLPYGMKDAELTPVLRAELAAFFKFSTQGSYASQSDPVNKRSAASYVVSLRQMLGWLHRLQGVPAEELGLRLLLPSAGRKGVKLVHEYIRWQETERGVCRRTLCKSLMASVQLAKFLYHEESDVQEGDKPYSDLQIMKALRAMYTTMSKSLKVESRVVDEQLKWLDWPTYLSVVDELRKECAGLQHDGVPRPRTAVAMSLQAYLIAAILSCIPDRQRTLRELQVGKTLVNDKDGRWLIRHGHDDYKTGRTYGERPPLLIPPHLYPELEAFINTWRAELKPQHPFLFTRKCGSSPLPAPELSRAFSLNVYRLTGKKTNPHLVRDMVVTFARDGNASEHELEALALYMAHSLAEQRGTYDRRTKIQKVEPAMGLMVKLSGGRQQTAAAVASSAAAAAAVAASAAAQAEGGS